MPKRTKKSSTTKKRAAKKPDPISKYQFQRMHNKAFQSFGGVPYLLKKGKKPKKK